MQEQIGVEMTESEARSELLDMAHGKTGAVPPEVLVDQVMAVAADGAGRCSAKPCRRCCGAAPLAKKTGCRCPRVPPAAVRSASTAPAREGIIGAAVPHVDCRRRDPIGASCDCADFLRNSLGLCKHALAALNDLYGRPRALRRATELQASGRPLRAADDPLGSDPAARRRGGLAGTYLRCIPGARNGGRRMGFRPPRSRLFAGDSGAAGVLRSTHADDPALRLRMVEELLGMIRAAATAPRGAGHRPRRAGAARSRARAACSTLTVHGLDAARDRARHRHHEAEAVRVPARGRAALPRGRPPACSPTTWASARRRRRSPPATCCGRPSGFGAAC